MYSSRLTRTPIGDMGAGWATSYSNFVAFDQNDAQSAIVFRGGQFLKFRESNGSWVPERGIFSSLLKKVNENGQFSGWEHRTEDDITETYDVTGRLTGIRSAGGLSQTLQRDANGRLLSLTDPAGRTVTFSYTPTGQVHAIRTPGGGVITYRYDSLENLTGVTKLDGKTRGYLYEDQYYPQALTGIIDENGNRYATYVYDMNGRATSSEHAGGVNKTTIVYNEDGTTTITTASGATITRAFQKINGVAKNITTAVTCPSCSPLNASFRYNEDGLLASDTDPRGRVTSYTYNSRGLLVEQTTAVGSPLSKTLAISWHPNFRMPTQLNADGKQYTMQYDARRNIIESSVSSEGKAQKFTYSYSPESLLLAADGPRQDVSDIFRFSYDGQGNVATITNPVGHKTKITAYTPQGWPATLIDPNGMEISVEYDSLGRITKSAANADAIRFSYNPIGLLNEIQFPDGSRQSYEYDAAHRLVKETDSQGNYVRYVKDAASRTLQTQVHDAAGNVIESYSQVFNPLDQLIQSQGVNEGPVKYLYDASGAIVQIERPSGGVTRLKYDDRGRLIESIDPLNGITAFSYDLRDRLASITDPKRLVTTYSYDGLDNVMQVLSPDAGKTSTQYDIAGNIKSATDARNKTTSYVYDALNRLTKVLTDGSTALEYEYDVGVNAVGQLTKSRYASGFTEWRYDNFGRTTEIAQHSSGSVHKLIYDFDGLGRLAMLVYPSGNVLTYGYTNDKLTAVNLNGKPLISNIVYRPFGGIKAWLWGNGKSSSRTFDLDGRLASYQLGSKKLIEYDAASRIVAVKDASIAALAERFSYDALDRVTGYVANSTQQSFSYDANGNRTHAQIGSSPLTYAYPQTSNRLQSISTQPPEVFSYDARGNATSAGTKQIVYDSFGRVAQARGPGGEFSNAYNGFHQRVAKTVSGSSVYFMYDTAGQLIGEYPSGGASKREHVYLEGVPIAVLDGGAASYVHTDYLGTPRLITDAGGLPIWSWYSDPFGTAMPNEDPDRNGVQLNYNLRFAGQYYDKETGLHQNYFRNYDPATGRYVQSDPIGLAGGINTYAYADNAPTIYTDPLGLWSIGIEGYAGLGGGVMFGRDPATGQAFLNIRFGYGIGGGFDYDPFAKRPGSDVCDKGSGEGFGVFGKAGGRAGPVKGGLGFNAGLQNGSSALPTNPYGSFASPKLSFTNQGTGISATAAAGAEFTIYGRGR